MLPKLQSMKNKKTSEEVVGLSPFKKSVSITIFTDCF